MQKYFAGVGSRETPKNIMELMIRLGRTATDLGYKFRSGDAYNADKAFWYGVQQSKKFEDIGAEIIIIEDGFRGRTTDEKIFYDYSKLSQDIKDQCMEIAKGVRGSFHGLNEMGIALHSRNVVQIKGLDLKSNVDILFLYAPLNRNGRVKGGTATAHDLAVKEEVPVIKNLYIDEDYQWCVEWLAEHESYESYNDIDWKQIVNAKLDWNPAMDGIDHINIYSKSQSELGRLLSNWAETMFVHPELGLFKTMEGFFAYLATGQKYDYLRTVSGFEAKKVLKDLPRVAKRGFEDELQRALTYKFEQSPRIQELLRKHKNLPITHYYWYGQLGNNPRIVPNEGDTWLEDGWNRIRNNFIINETLKVTEEGN